MISKIKKPVSILLVFMMIVSLFVAVPVTANALDQFNAKDLSYDNIIKAGDRVFANLKHNKGPSGEVVSGSSFTIYDEDKKVNLKAFATDWVADKDYIVTKTNNTYYHYDYPVYPDCEETDVTVYTIHVREYVPAPPTYTVTWKNGETTLKTDTFDKDAIPAYSGDVPTKAASEDKHYTFSGWSDGTNTYSADSLPAVTADVTYTAQFTEAAHSYTTPSFNWTQDASTGDWDCNTLTLACSCGDTQEYAATGFFGASAVTVTANDDGSFTYSVSKKVDGVTYSDTKTTAANGVVKSSKQLKAAAKKGGEWELGADLTDVTDVQCANGFVLDGNNHTVTRNANVSTQAVFRTTTNPAVVTLKNLTIDGIEGQSDSKPAVATKMSNPSDGNVINLENVTITNYDFDQANNGVVLAWGQATVNMTDCNVVTDSTYDVWGGAASKVNISGGTVGAAYLNGGSAQAAITDGATVSSITAANGSKIATDSPATISVGEDYKLKANGDGTYTVVPKDYVAQIGETKYETLAEAFAAAVDGNTIKVLADSTGNGIKVPQGKFSTNGLTVDFNGFEYVVDANTVGSTGTETNGFQLLKNNKITFKNGSINSGEAKILVQNYSDLTLEKMELSMYNDDYSTAYTLSNNNGNVVIDSSAISANTGGGFAFDVCRYASYPSVNVTVKGDSVIDGNVEIFASKSNPMNGFSLTLESGTLNGNIVVDKTAQNVIKATPEKAKVTKENTFNQEAPLGYEWVDNGDGTSKLAPAAYPLDELITKVADGNKFGINSQYLVGTILGVQKKAKASVDAATTSDKGAQEAAEGSDMRFVAVLDTETLRGADDYGFVLAKVGSDKNTTNTIFDNLKMGDDRAKTISAKNTYNNICGDERYGDPTNDSTSYKYVTCAVNGVDDSSKIVARFYVVKDGKTYYAKYAGYNYQYRGVTAGIADLPD